MYQNSEALKHFVDSERRRLVSDKWRFLVFKRSKGSFPVKHRIPGAVLEALGIKHIAEEDVMVAHWNGVMQFQLEDTEAF